MATWKDVTVAVKTVSKTDENTLKDFNKELALMAKLRHRNLVQLRGACWENGIARLCLVLDFCGKGSLQDILENPDPNHALSWFDPYCELIKGVARCMRYLHHEQRNKVAILHRDLKPANILVDDNMQSKVADLGGSRPLDRMEGRDEATMVSARMPSSRNRMRERALPTPFAFHHFADNGGHAAVLRARGKSHRQAFACFWNAMHDIALFRPRDPTDIARRKIRTAGRRVLFWHHPHGDRVPGLS